VLATVSVDYWSRLEALESSRRQALLEHERTMRELYAAAGADPDGDARQVFRRYCQTAATLEEALVELEQFRLRASR
jgi:hypothetical protein